MTYAEYVEAYEAMLSIYLKGYKPTNNPIEIKTMIEAADKVVDFEEAHPTHSAKYEAEYPNHYYNFQA